MPKPPAATLHNACLSSPPQAPLLFYSNARAGAAGGGGRSEPSTKASRGSFMASWGLAERREGGTRWPRAASASSPAESQKGRTLISALWLGFQRGTHVAQLAQSPPAPPLTSCSARGDHQLPSRHGGGSVGANEGKREREGAEPLLLAFPGRERSFARLVSGNDVRG